LKVVVGIDVLGLRIVWTGQRWIGAGKEIEAEVDFLPVVHTYDTHDHALQSVWTWEAAES
jgi:regulation of enolase protein 1 (concanavalin A-like superfamily)